MRTTQFTSWMTVLFLIGEAAAQSPLSFPFEREHEITPVGKLPGASVITAGDLNGDGAMDVAATAVDADLLAVWINEGGKGRDLQQKVLLKPFDGARTVTLIDMDKDGDLDVLACGNDGQVDSLVSGARLWENVKNAAWKMHEVAPRVPRAQGIGAGDIDGDGDMDVVVADEDQVQWFEQDSLDEWVGHAVGPGRSGTGVAVADFTGDGHADIAACFWTDDKVRLWVGGQRGREWKEITIADHFNFPTVLYAVDMDGDKDMDLIGASSGKHKVCWWENVDGEGTFAEHVVSSELRSPWGVHAGDVDGDGDMDIAACGKSNGDVWWFERDGSSWKPHLVQNDFDFARSVWFADMDGDGDLDLLGASQNRGQLRWWENRR